MNKVLMLSLSYLNSDLLASACSFKIKTLSEQWSANVIR